MDNPRDRGKEDSRPRRNAEVPVVKKSAARKQRGRRRRAGGSGPRREQRLIALLEGALELAVSVLLPAVIFIPWFTNVIQAWIALGLAWLGATLFALKHLPSKTARVVSAVVAVAVVYGATEVRPTPSLTGTVEPTLISRITEFVLASDENSGPGVKITRGGPLFHATSESDEKNLRFFEESNSLKVETIGGRSFVTTTIRDDRGDIIATVKRNEWKIAQQPASWDRNYSSDALEILDRQGRVIFQLVAIGNHVEIQGEWRTDPGNHKTRADGLVIKSFRIADGAISVNPREDGPVTIEPIFEYPGDEHLGERVDVE